MVELGFEVNCPHCKKSLMDPYRQINNKPSIRVRISINDQIGTVRLSSVYGDYDFVSDLTVNKGDIAVFICPHCEKELNTKEECTECGAPMIDFKLSIGGKVCICSRSGCRNHSVGFVDLSSALNSFYQHYNYGGNKQ